jgi:hypothetical protein
MPYCTVSDVQKLFGNITFSASTPVTDTDITNVHIPKADATMDARLRRVYTVPITAPGDLELLRLVSMSLTAGMVAEVLYETSSQPNDQASARRHREWGERMLDQIMSGELTLATQRGAVADAGVFEDYEAVPETGRSVKPLVRMSGEF